MKAVIPYRDSIKIIDKPIPKIENSKDAIVRVTYTAICTSDLHIINNAVPRYVPDTVLGHEFVGEVISIGNEVKNLKIGDRVAANCITFCGECEFCKQGFINNCKNGGWELGCRIDGGQAEYVRIPFADMGLNKIPDNVSYESALFVGDILSSGHWGIGEIPPHSNIGVIGAGPVGLCAMMCAKVQGANVTVFEIDEHRAHKAIKLGFADEIGIPTGNYEFDLVVEAAGGEDTFELAWKIARPNATVSIVAMYEKPQILPLNIMYGKNLTFKTGGVDAIHCDELLEMISDGKISTDFLISKIYPLEEAENAYKEFRNKSDTESYKIILKSAFDSVSSSLNER